MIEIPAYALVIGFAAAALAVGAAIVLATAQRRRYLDERRQRSRFQLVWKHSTDLMAVARVSKDGRFFVEDLNAANVDWFQRAFPGIRPEEWTSTDLETLMRTRMGYDDAEVDAVLANHREAVRTGKPVNAINEFRTAGETLYRQALFTPVLDKGGRVTHLFYRATDITELRRAKARVDAILDASPLMVSIIARDSGHLRYVNDAWCRTTGIGRNRAMAMDVYEAGLWKSPEERNRALAPVFERGEAQQNERTQRLADGSTRHRLVTVLPYDFEGEPCTLNLSFDITELASAREQAQAMQAHFERIFRLIPEPVSLSTMDEGRFIEVNDAWLQMYGLEASQVIGRTVDDLGMWVDKGGRADLVARVRAGERVTGLAARLRTRTGIVHNYISAERISWKGESALLVASRDVTDLERARRVSVEESRHFTRTFAASPLPLAIAVGLEGRLVEVNEAWVAFFGIPREEAIGHTAKALRVFEDGADRDRLVDAVERGEIVRNAPCRMRKRSGEIAEMILSVEPMEWYGAGGRITALQDVTALHQSADEIRRLNDSLEAKVRERTAELERAVEEMESFSYSVSHDLRAPLRHIAGFTRMLVEDGHVQPGTEAARYAERASMAATKLGTLIDDLLDYSRLGRKALTVVETDLARTVSSILEEIADGLGGRDVAWEIAPLPKVRADPTLIRLVMQNLIDNALKYSGNNDATRIEVGARRDGDADTVWVRDNGVGFDMQYSGKLFGVFQRMHTDAEFEGTGIGLANAKRIVERHGGRIWFEAAPGRGATFYFSLPR